jgi:putative tricarboxylic transport membrane protein
VRGTRRRHDIITGLLAAQENIGDQHTETVPAFTTIMTTSPIAYATVTGCSNSVIVDVEEPTHGSDTRATRADAMRRRQLSSLVLVLVVLLGLSSCGSLGGDERLRVMVPNSPGGGYDVTARAAVKITETTGITNPVQVFNLSGAGGTLALTRLMHETDNPDLLMMMGLGVIGATVTNKSSPKVTDATPIARLIEEQEGVMVPADSPYRTITDLVAAWRARPDQFTVGGGSLTGGPDHLMSMQLAAAVGIAPRQVNYISHDGGGELLPALLGHHIDFATSGVREYTEQIKSGQLRVLAVSGETPVPNVAAPTLTASGIDVVFSNWRGIIAPPGITEADRATLISIFTQLDQTPEWQAELTKNGWTDALITGDDFGAFLAQQDQSVESALQELGLG